MATLGPVVLKFAADISGIESGVGRVASSMDRLEGGAAKVGAGLLKAFSGAAVLGAVTSFGRAVLEDADSIVRLSDKLGIGAESVQRLTAVAEESGNSIEQLSGAISQMQKRLAGNDSSAVSALNQLHIGLGVLKSMDPEAQFYAISRSIAAVEDPAERVRLAVALFGKTGAEILPSIRADIDKITKGVVVMHDDVARRLDESGDNWGRYWRNIKAYAANTFDYLFHNYARAEAAAKEAMRLPALPNSPFSSMPLPTTDAFALQDAMDKANPIEKQLERARATEKAADAQKRFNEELQRSTEAARHVEPYFYGIARALDNVDNTELENLKTMANLRAEIDRVEQSARISQFGFQGMSDELADVGEKATVAAPKMRGFMDSFKSVLSGDFKLAFNDLKAMVDPSKIFNTALGGVLSGGISSLLGLASKGISALFGKLFDNPEKQINPLRQAFVDAAGGLATLNERAHAAGMTLDKLLDAKNPQQYKAAIDELNSAFAFQDSAMATLNETVSRYGFTIEELGPKFRQQKLDETAGALIQDFQVLTAAGIDQVAILEKMAPTMNEYIQTVMAAGGTIPLQLKDPLEKLAKMGLLTDAAGEKMTDVSKLTFAETLDAKFQTLIDSIGKLVDAISNRLGPAIQAAIPANPFAGWQVPDVGFGGVEPVQMADGGFGHASGPMLFSTRGNEDFAFSGEGRRFGGNVVDMSEMRRTREAIERMERNAERDRRARADEIALTVAAAVAKR